MFSIPKIKIDKPMSKAGFKFMVRHFKNRDKNYPPHNKIEKINIHEGNIVLDYGCGSGSYSIAAAEVVGARGKVFAADIHPLAIEEVKRRAQEKNLNNIETILTDCDTNLEDSIINVALLLDIYHDLSAPENILNELHRVLKNDGLLAVDDHHLKEDEIISNITNNKLFKFVERVDEVLIFKKASN